MKKSIKIMSLMTVLMSFSAHASNCQTHSYKNGKWSGSKDLGIIIKQLNNDDLITHFLKLGHGDKYPTYILKAKNQNSDGSYNLEFQGAENDSTGNKPMALAEGYVMEKSKKRILIKTLSLENEDFTNVTCQAQDE